MDVETTDVKTLEWPDYIVIGIVLSISALTGIYYRFTGGRQRTSEEYFSANRSMGIIPLSIALMVSFVSAITILGISAETYIYGTQIVVVYFGASIGTIISMLLYIPVFFELNIMSVFEYLERRFGVTARLVSSVAYTLQLLLYTGIVLFAPTLALEATTGMSATGSILLVGIICTFYSAIGGIKAVIITDVYQGILIFVGIFCVLAIAAGELENGLSDVLSIAENGGRIEFFNFSFDPTIRHTTWSLLFGGMCIQTYLFGVSQVQVQRLLTLKDVKSSQKALLLSIPIVVAIGVLTAYSGLVLYAVYKDCDPLTSGQISSPDKIMPLFVVRKMSRIPGLSGLFIAGIFSATLSTISATLNSLSAVVLEDYVKPLYGKTGLTFPKEKSTLIAKVLSMSIGFICLGIAFLARTLGTLIQVSFGITGAIGGPLLGIFSLGLFSEVPNEFGAVTGCVTGLIICLWAVFGSPKPVAEKLPLSIEGCDNTTLLEMYTNVTKSVSDVDETSYFYLYRISYLWYTPLGFCITLIVGYIISLVVRGICPSDMRELDPNLFVSFVASRIRRRRQDADKTTSSQVFVLEHRK